MNVSAVMNPLVETCSAYDEMNRAAQILWDEDCGCVPVVDETNHVVGILTDRDICMAAYTQGKPLSEMKVHEAMARMPHCCRAEDRVEEALRLMRDGRVRRLPVVDGGDRLVGMLSLADVVQRAPDLLVDEIVATLAAITEPRELEGDGMALQPTPSERAVAAPPKFRTQAAPAS